MLTIKQTKNVYNTRAQTFKLQQVVKVLKDRNKDHFRSFRNDKSGWIIDLPDSSFKNKRVASVADILDSVSYDDKSCLLYINKNYLNINQNQIVRLLKATFGATFQNNFERLSFVTKRSKLRYEVPGSNGEVKIEFKFVKVTFKSAEYANVFHILPKWDEIKDIVGTIGMCIKI